MKTHQLNTLVGLWPGVTVLVVPSFLFSQPPAGSGSGSGSDGGFSPQSPRAAQDRDWIREKFLNGF